MKAAAIVQEIAADSKEQSSGMGQIKIAVSELDQVTQRNAASAEEFAAAGAELLSQSSDLRHAFERLAEVLHGTGTGTGATPRPQLARMKKAVGKATEVKVSPSSRQEDSAFFC